MRAFKPQHFHPRLLSLLFPTHSLLTAKQVGSQSLNACLCLRSSVLLSRVADVSCGPNAGVPAPEHECCLLTLIGSLCAWSHRTVAEWRGLRMRSTLLLRHGHTFAERGAHYQTVRVPLIPLSFTILQYIRFLIYSSQARWTR